MLMNQNREVFSSRRRLHKGRSTLPACKVIMSSHDSTHGRQVLAPHLKPNVTDLFLNCAVLYLSLNVTPVLSLNLTKVWWTLCVRIRCAGCEPSLGSETAMDAKGPIVRQRRLSALADHAKRVPRQNVGMWRAGMKTDCFGTACHCQVCTGYVF